MKKNKSLIFLFLLISLSRVFAQDGTELERFAKIYSRWALDHSDYECEMTPKMEMPHSSFRLWQILNENKESDSILKITSDMPIYYEAYIYMTEEQDEVMHFPETDRTILLYPEENFKAVLRVGSIEILDFQKSLEFLKQFLSFEKLTEVDEGFLFEMVLDAKKMESEGVISSGSDVNAIRLIFVLKKDGQFMQIFRQFDEDPLLEMDFNYISFSPDEVRMSFPKIEDRSSKSITRGFSFRDALEEIKQKRETNYKYIK